MMLMHQASEFGLQAFLHDFLVPRTLFSHFCSDLSLLNPEILEQTNQGIEQNGKHGERLIFHNKKGGISGGFFVVSRRFLAADKQFGGGYPIAAYNGVAKQFCGVFDNRWHNGRQTQNKVAMHFAVS
ncbi:hypothetical protein PIB30_098173 [Stylosanthes scabra]|uniref:Uncharacterized protein n=1 Tax=Stylosanthes scabra TaxID=79078 RepID=A0ABU6RX95_9FABA|nr:hypothetical protein [Stylosanthes scabra]